MPQVLSEKSISLWRCFPARSAERFYAGMRQYFPELEPAEYVDNKFRDKKEYRIDQERLKLHILHKSTHGDAWHRCSLEHLLLVMYGVDCRDYVMSCV